MAAAAAAAAVHPLPRSLTRRTVAWLACTHLAMAAVDVVYCLFLASMWLLHWGLATMEIGRLACGEGCAVVTAAYKVVSVAAWVTLLLVLPFSVLLLVLAVMMARTKTATATDMEAAKEPAPKKSDAEMQETLCDDFLALGLLALMAFTLLKLIGVLVKGDSPVIGSHRERMGSVIYDGGALGTAMGNCFFSCPFMTVRIWRAWRMARAWRKARHAL